MNELSTKKYLLYLLIGIVILWIIAYACFAFILMDFNAYNWTKENRGGLVFIDMTIAALSIPLSQLIKM